MRADMHRVISSSRHRRGKLFNKVKQKGQSRALSRLADDELPHMEPMKSRKGFRSRRQKFDVLKRFVTSQIGRRWADVFSEVCSQMDSRNPLQNEIREWTKRFVDEDVQMLEGVPFERNGRWRVHGVWVHPKTGVLMAPPAKPRRELTAEESERRRRWKRRASHDSFKIDSNHRLVHLDDGPWYVVTLKPLPDVEPVEYEHWPVDVMSWGSWGDWIYFRHRQLIEWGDYVYAAEKRPASNRVIKRYSQPATKADSDNRVVMRPPG